MAGRQVFQEIEDKEIRYDNLNLHKMTEQAVELHRPKHQTTLSTKMNMQS